MSQRSRYMTQLRHPVSTCASCAAQWKMWLFKVFGVIYMVAVCASQENDVSTYSYQTSESTAAPPLFEPPVPDLQRTSSWSDVFSSEKVELKCSAASSSELIFTWKKNGSPLGSGPNLSQSPDKSVLTITATSQQDSGNYSCAVKGKKNPSQTKESGVVKIQVYASTPKPTLTRDSDFGKMFPGESITFSCSVDVSSGWEYLWYHGQNQIPAVNTIPYQTYTINSATTQKSGQYYCKGKRGQVLTDPSESITLDVIDPPTPVLQLQTAWKDVFENEAVEFCCQVDNSGPGWMFTWHRNSQQLQNNSVETINGDGSSLKITSVRQTHNGSYTCKAHLTSRGVNSGFSKEVTIQVKKIPVPALTETPQWKQVFPTESVKFKCGMGQDSYNWTYTWYRDGKQVHADDTVSFDANGAGLSISSASADHTGTYKCSGQIQNRAVTSQNSSEVSLTVYAEKPTLTLTRDPNYEVMFAGEVVTFSCAISVQSEWKYLWYKNGKELPGSSDKLVVPISGTADGGSYTCKATRGQNPAFTTDLSAAKQLEVRAEKPTLTLTRDPNYEVMFAGEVVTFNCTISVQSEWKYLWYKNGKELPGSSDKLVVPISGTADRGSYTCKATRGQNPAFTTDLSAAKQLKVQENKPKPSMTQQPDAKKLYIGEKVSFECKVENSDGWSYDWYKDETSILTNNNSLKMEKLSWPNRGAYKCKAKRNKTGFNTEFSDQRTFEVSEIPVPTLKLVTKWSDVFPAENVTMSCEMQKDSADWTYAFYRDETKVQDYNSKNDTRNLSITSASTSNRGSYSCSGKLKSRDLYSNKSSPLNLHVYDAKPTVTLEQNPAHDLMHSDDSVSFNCHVNVSSGWEYLWYKDDLEWFGSSGSNHNITSVTTKDSGSYKCKVKRGTDMVFFSDHSNSVHLKVEERPKATIVLLTGWSEVFSTDSLSLKCEVKGYTWENYTWSREGEKIHNSATATHEVTPTNDPDQSTYTCHGLRNERPLYSKSSDSFKTKNLLLKRRVLLSISGCIVFGIAVVLIGCMALRIFRKPNGRDDKMEEVNLFPTMAELKITDVPCPLVEYITDASLNAPAKAEEEENGTVCNETTPLPITKQEDQAATTDNQETTETNGGLSSFQK